MVAPLTAVRRSEDSAPTEPLSFPLAPRTLSLLGYGCAPLLVCLLGWLAQGCFENLHLVPILAIDFATPLHRVASLTIPC